MKTILAAILLTVAGVTAASAQGYGSYGSQNYYGGGGVDYNPHYQEQQTYSPPHHDYVEPHHSYHQEYHSDSYVAPHRSYDSSYNSGSHY